MQENRIKDIIAAKPSTTEITIQGWVRAFRSNRFIALNDGSTIKNLQCVVDFENFEETLLKKVSIGAAIKVTGSIVESQGNGQKVEIQVSKNVIHFFYEKIFDFFYLSLQIFLQNLL